MNQLRQMLARLQDEQDAALGLAVRGPRAPAMREPGLAACFVCKRQGAPVNLLMDDGNLLCSRCCRSGCRGFGKPC